ncbi:lipopolysaccharide assembly protein LapB [Pleurocapsa sp. CCALA 161]|uniref:tetratricopeptide repeat protein n=1 Tax=Pleurocapsa sp. CCALA 161 TaxID=2107688 RepID=UPI000D0821B6|nr:tetratricopeptide repeat protein [Pleurocapsa sp. CCALA 161]
MNSWKVVLSCFLAGSINLLATQKLLAQSQIANPLQTGVDSRDPLIPDGYGKRQLSSFEIYRLKQEIERLEQTATQELQQGNTNRSFELFYRQLKLARAINTEVEIEALGKVGAIAWQENRAGDLRNIANRLMGIEKKITIADLDSKLLERFAIAYQQIKYPEQAIAIYQQILSNNKQQKNLVAVEANLKTLGELYIAKFNYSSAAKTYQELLTLAESKSNSEQVNFYLNTLINLYDRTNQIAPAIATRERLIENYTAVKKLAQVAKLELAIAHDYQTLTQTPKAIEAYERGFRLASTTQQLAIADDALDSLGKLYLKERQEKKAIATFTQLLTIQRQSYNHYGLINTYDTLGKIYLKSERKTQAKQYFQQALKLAQALDYKVEYFQQQIAKL